MITEKLNKTHKNKFIQNTAKQNKPGLVIFYYTRPENEVLNLQRS